MKIKTTILSVLAAAAVCASPLSVSAENRSALTPEEAAGVLAKIEEYNASEGGTYVGMLTLDDIKKLDSEDQAKFNMNEITESYDPNAPDIMSEIINSDKDDIDVSNCFKITGYDVNKAYKLYHLTYELLTEYKANPDFKALIFDNDNPSFMLPSDNQLVELRKKDDGYKISSSEFTSYIPDFNTLIESIISSLNEEVLNVVHTYSDSYYMDIIYIETAQNEYAVPYFDFSKCPYFDPGDRLVSGTVYTTAEFMDRMDQSYTENFQPYDENGDALAGGGIELKEYAPYVPSAMATKSAQTPASAATEDPSVFSTALLITAAVIFLSFLTAIVVFSRKKHRRNKKPEA